MTITLGTALAAMAAVMVLGVRGAMALRPTRTRTGGRLRTRRPLRTLRRPTTGRGPSDVDVADWCEDMARSLRSGRSLTTTFTDSTDAHPRVAPVIDPVIAQVSRGRSLVDSLRTAATDPATGGGLALAVLRTCAELGGPGAVPLERVAATLRARDAIAQEQRAHSAQAQMSARVMTLVPIGMLGLLATTDPRVRGAIGSPAGAGAVSFGALLNLVGWWWMQRIIGRPR